MKFVYLIGTDGAGKTTLAKRLVAERLGGVDWQYLYCQTTPILILPLQLIARRLFLKKATQFEDYEAYRANKRAASARRKLPAQLYCLVWYCDFLWQAWTKVFLAWCRRKPVIVDRFHLDCVVNCGVLLGSSTEDMLRVARRLGCLLPRPDVTVFLNVSEAVAFSRKDDIPSPEYLRERKSRYLNLVGPCGFHQLDADQPLEVVRQQAVELIGRLLKF